MSLKEAGANAAIEAAVRLIAHDPEKGIDRALKLVETFDPAGRYTNLLAAIGKNLNDPHNNWRDFAVRLFTEVDEGILARTISNFVLNASVKGSARQEEVRDVHGCNAPWALLVDPTSACNLHCTGCWAAEYGNRLNLSYEQLDDIVNQANDLGVYFILFSGGEPLVRKDDVIALCAAHPDTQFLAFTNGTLIDDRFADDMLRVRNFIPAISVEGYEDDTDFRRGAGTFAKVERAMAILRERRLPFGLSCCYTSKNTSMIGSERYFDQMIEWGARFCWLFTYMPVGTGATTELMVSAEQRAWMYEQVRLFRETKPLFALDFWNDGDYSGGCIAGGRRYLHINANGDMEPCAFVHYSDSNIAQKTILEALKSPLFKAYQAGQPFNGNHLRPCPVLDNPDALERMVAQSGAHSTDLASPEDACSLCAKCRPAAQRWATAADALLGRRGDVVVN